MYYPKLGLLMAINIWIFIAINRTKNMELSSKSKSKIVKIN